MTSKRVTTEDRLHVAKMITHLSPEVVRDRREDVAAALQAFGDRSDFTQQLQWDLHVLAVRVGLEDRRQPPQALKEEQQAARNRQASAIQRLQQELLRALADANFPEADRPVYSRRAMFGRTKQWTGRLRYEVYQDTVSVRNPTGDDRGPFSEEWRSFFLTIDGEPVNRAGELEAAYDPLKGVRGLYAIAARAGIRLPVPEELRSHAAWPRHLN
ncbi:hypothetical protein [Geodermatophilus sp. SYSU D01036]